MTHADSIASPTRGLLDIADKLDAGVRLTLDDGVRLFECPDLLAVGWLANRERERRHGGRTYYNHNIRLEATNVCVASCLFCSFARLKPGDPGAYTMSLEEAWDKLRARAAPAAHRSPRRQRAASRICRSTTTRSCCAASSGSGPDIHLKCFTAVEIAFFADLYGDDRRAGAARADGGRARFAAGRRRGDLRRARAPQDRATTSAAPIATSRFTAPRTGSACART